METTKNYSSSSPLYYLGRPPNGVRTIGGVSWNHFFTSNEYGEGPYIPPVYALTKENGGVFYGIRIRQTRPDGDQEQILSTFEFLD